MKIVSIDVHPVEYRTRMFFKFFTTPRGASGRPSVVIKVTTEEGIVGWGQSVPIATWSDETMETATLALRNYYAPVLIGRDARDLDGAHAAMDAAIRPSFSTGMPLTRAGMDMALWDIAGKAAGKSLAGLWGLPHRGRCELSWTVNVKSLEDVAASVEKGKAMGYRHFNVKVAPDPAFDREVVTQVRDLAPDGFLWTDANCGYDLETALAAAPMLADLGVQVFESPLPPNRISGYRALKRQGAVPIYMDEGIVSPVELGEFLGLEMLDGVAMKPARCGGLSSNKRQIELCLDHGLKWAGSGLCDPDLSLAAALALYDAFGLETAAVLNGPQFLGESLLKTPIAITGGVAEVPEGAGLGVAVDEAALAEMAARTAKEWGFA